MDASAPAPPEPQALAEACARAMWVEDQASQSLGMRIERIAPGEAVLTMTVAERMVNGHGICHGGFIFTLANSAFAFACNTYDRRTVAQHCAVTFIAPLAPWRGAQRPCPRGLPRRAFRHLRRHRDGRRRRGRGRVPRALAHDQGLSARP